VERGRNQPLPPTCQLPRAGNRSRRIKGNLRKSSILNHWIRDKMPPAIHWTCVECGCRGSFERPGAGVCSRRGLPILKGQGRCCFCAMNGGWQGMADCGCYTCHLRAKIPFPAQRKRFETAELCVDPPLPVASCVPWRARAHPWDKNKGLDPRLQRAFKLSVFAFDSCLFRTPARPPEWPFSSYRSMPQSLSSAMVPESPDSDWFHNPPLDDALVAMRDPDTVTALVCTRGSYLKARVLQILESAGVSLDEAVLMPSSSSWSVTAPACAPEALAACGAAGALSCHARELDGRTRNAVFSLYAVLSLVERYPAVTQVDAWVPDAATAALLAATSEPLAGRGVRVCVRVAQVEPHSPAVPEAPPDSLKGGGVRSVSRRKRRAPSAAPLAGGGALAARGGGGVLPARRPGAEGTHVEFGVPSRILLPLLLLSRGARAPRAVARGVSQAGRGGGWER